MMNGFLVLMFMFLGIALIIGILDITAKNHAAYLAKELQREERME